MKVLLFSDIHVACHRKSLDRLINCLDALQWVFDTAKAHNISDIIFAGDLFQDRTKIDILVYHHTFNVLKKNCNKSLRLWLLLGNHDLWYHDKWDISSVAPMSAIEGITVIDKPETLEISGSKIDFLPYTHHPLEHLAELRSKRNKTLVAHLAVDGSQLNTLHNTRADVTIEHDGEMVKVDADSFKGWDQVFLGHYHGQQKISDNAEYIGSTLQLSFGEAFQHKHIIIYDTVAGTKEYVRNKFSPQHFIIPESDINKYDLTNNFIRIEAIDIGSASLVDLKNTLQQQNPGSLEILSVGQQDSEHLVEDAKAILADEKQMLKGYVYQVDTGDLDKDFCVLKGEEICQHEKTKV